MTALVKRASDRRKTAEFTTNVLWKIFSQTQRLLVQEGITVFRYSIRPHQTYSQTAAQHFGIERSQPLIAVPTNKNAPIRGSLLQVEPAGVIVTSFKPSMDGKAWMVRLFNTGERPQKARLLWAQPQSRSLWLSNSAEERVARIDGPIEMAAYEIITLSCQLPK